MSLNIPPQFPAYSLLDPTYTCTVPRRQTAAGTADIMSHIMEVYFSKTPGAFFPDRIMEAMLKTCVKYGTIACCEDPTNYEARANLLWTASWGCNGFFDCGKIGRRWSVHPMEHQLGAYYDETHGIGIAILTIHWMSHSLDEIRAERRHQRYVCHLRNQRAGESARKAIRCSLPRKPSIRWKNSSINGEFRRTFARAESVLPINPNLKSWPKRPLDRLAVSTDLFRWTSRT